VGVLFSVEINVEGGLFLLLIYIIIPQ